MYDESYDYDYGYDYGYRALLARYLPACPYYCPQPALVIVYDYRRG